MSKLNDIQLVLLSNAAKRDDGGLTRSAKLRPEAMEQAVAGLLSRKFIRTVPKTGSLPLWKKEPDGEPVSLVITEKGLEAIGIAAGDPNQPPRIVVTKGKASKAKEPTGGPTKKTPSAKPKPGGPRPSSKIARVVEMLRKPGGASIKAIMDATDWQAHSVRGAIAGAIKKKMGLRVVAETRGDERVYRIGG
ncbi:MAG: DUF3489 domain-containing protein [Alphaproteobacteria bacterium]|nr:DUF3489 domain-containing protein [Alphaproteobacteria bacterium]